MSRYRGFVGDVERASREGGGRAVVSVCPPTRPSGVGVWSMREMSIIHHASIIIHRWGATLISLHNGGGVGWGEVVNGGFGLVIDGSDKAQENIDSMISWDVNNGIARRSWARNSGAISAINRAMDSDSSLVVTVPEIVDENLLEDIFDDTR